MTATVPRLTFAEDTDGNLYIARGDQPVKRWNGLTAALVDAGLTAPANAPTVGGSSTGVIVGRRFAYQRTVDVDGRVSNLSPISTVYNPTASTKSITAATNATPVVITSVAHGYSDGDTLKIEGAIGNRGANGTWIANVLTADTIELTGSSGTGAYLGGGTIYKGVGQIDYSNLGAITDTRAAKRQILRNADGNALIFYVDAELTNLATTTATSTKTDAQLLASEEVALVDVDGSDLNLATHAEPPTHKRVIVPHYSRAFMAVDGYHKQGAVAVTNGSPTVTGIDTAFTTSMAGWLLYISDSATTTVHTISSVNASTQTITLTGNYSGTTNAFVYYCVRPSPGEKYTLYFSQSGYFDSFRLANALQITNDTLAGEVTGLMPFGQNLFILFENKIFALSYLSRPNDGEVVLRRWRGCINQRCWTIVENVAYCLDSQGIYSFAEEHYSAISQGIRPIFQRDGSSKYSINWAASESFHCLHSPRAETIKWFVALGSDTEPRHAICYQYRTERWWIEEWPVPIMSSCVGNRPTGLQTFLGLTARRVAMSDIGYLDGVIESNPATRRGTVTSSTLVSLSDSTATFDSSLANAPLQIVDGTGAGQMRLIAAVSTTKLTVKEPWLVKPDTTSVYQVGGIRWRYSTGKLRYAQTGRLEKRGLELSFIPNSLASRLSIRRYHDESLDAVSARRSRTSGQGNGLRSDAGVGDIPVNTQKADGYVRLEDNSTRGEGLEGVRYLRIELEGVTNGEDQKIRGIRVIGAEP